MANRILSDEDKKNILELYKNGNSYTDISKKFGVSTFPLVKILKGIRSLSDAIKLARINGKYKLSDKGRIALSEAGIKSCIRSGKFWTKPERAFRDILLEMGIGVKYPEYIKEIKKVEDDKLAKLFYYQYPIQRYVLDYVDVENKVAININGDYWHGNPLLYEPNNLYKQQIANIRQDKNKKIFLEKNGWLMLDVWESEIYWNKEAVKEKIRAVSLTEKHVVYTDKSGVQLPHCLPDWSETIKRLWFKKGNKKKAEKIKVICSNKNCQKEFETTFNIRKIRKYCSADCFGFSERKVNRPSKEELEKLMSDNPLTSIGKQYGVSNNAVKKWAKKYGII